MGHMIHGFLAGYEALATAATTLGSARVCRLGQDIGFLAATIESFSEDEPASQFDSLDRLTARMEAWAREQSNRFPIAYIQTDYFGGLGAQQAIVWRHGRVQTGPLETSNLDGRATPVTDAAINQAARQLGVQREHTLDEFEALGLGNYRDNESWIAASSKEQV